MYVSEPLRPIIETHIKANVMDANRYGILASYEEVPQQSLQQETTMLTDICSSTARRAHDPAEMHVLLQLMMMQLSRKRVVQGSSPAAAPAGRPYDVIYDRLISTFSVSVPDSVVTGVVVIHCTFVEVCKLIKALPRHKRVNKGHGRTSLQAYAARPV